MAGAISTWRLAAEIRRDVKELSFAFESSYVRVGLTGLNIAFASLIVQIQSP